MSVSIWCSGSPGHWAITGVIINVISSPQQQGEQLSAGNRPRSHNRSRKGQRSLGVKFGANIENLHPTEGGEGGGVKTGICQISDCPLERLRCWQRRAVLSRSGSTLHSAEKNTKWRPKWRMFYDKTTTRQRQWQRPTQLNILKFLQSDSVRPIQLFGKDKMGLQASLQSSV